MSPFIRRVAPASLIGIFALTGCLPSMDVLPPFDKKLDHPGTMIERALADCPSRSPEGETACVRRAVTDGRLGAPALAAMIPGCQIGRMCVMDYTTDEKLGYLNATATRFRVHWRVTVDLKASPKRPEDVPVTVTPL